MGSKLAHTVDRTFRIGLLEIIMPMEATQSATTSRAAPTSEGDFSSAEVPFIFDSAVTNAVSRVKVSDGLKYEVVLDEDWFNDIGV